MTDKRFVDMYALAEKRLIKDPSERIRVVLPYLVNPSEVVGDEPFKTLARSKWKWTEQHAAHLWEGGATEGRMTVLSALLAAKSELLDYYLNKAMKSSDRGLRSCAGAIAKIRYI